MNFARSAQFHMKTRVCLKYFVHDCRFSKSENTLSKSGKTNGFNKWSLLQHIGNFFYFVRGLNAQFIYKNVTDNCNSCSGEIYVLLIKIVILRFMCHYSKVAKLYFEIYFDPGGNGMFKIKKEVLKQCTEFDL